jgi:hypothetical protein
MHALSLIRSLSVVVVLASVGFACRSPPVDSADEPTTMPPESSDPCTWGEGGEAIARTLDGVGTSRAIGTGPSCPPGMSTGTHGLSYSSRE